MPGYIADGIFFDGLDLTYPDNPSNGLAGYPRFRANNYQEAFMWPDDTAPDSDPYSSTSLWRMLMFRNYPNLLTGFYIYRPDEPLSSATEPLDDTVPATQRPLYGLGPYYPSAGFYWPFGSASSPVGVDYDSTYALVNPNSDPDPNGNQANLAVPVTSPIRLTCYRRMQRPSGRENYFTRVSLAVVWALFPV